METQREPEARALFEYTAFDDPSSELRLIQIHRELATTEYGEVVQCTVNNVPWVVDFPYCALSYTWGDLEDIRPVIVNDKLKFVTSNLADFLNVCRETLVKDDGDLSHAFWIDAISINQDDNEEKSVQVRHMGKIYEDAARVMVWLGPEQGDSELAYEFLRALNESCDPVLERLNELQASGGMFVLDDERQVPEPYDFGSIRWIIKRIIDSPESLSALLSLVSRHWWRRVWVQQEIFFGPVERTSMVCGRRSIPWKQVVFGELTLHHIVMLLSRQIATPRTFSVSDWREIQNKLTELVQHMARTSRNSYHQIWPQDLGKVNHKLIDRLVVSSMNRTTRLAATLPQDYIFSILAICADAQEATDGIRIDYSRSEYEVYIDVARYLFKHVGAPILGFAGVDTARELSLPSWVPNWSVALPRQPLCWRKDVFDRDHQDQIYRMLSAASAFAYTIESSVLRIKGYEIDSIPLQGLTRDLFPPIRPEDLRATPSWHRQWLASYKLFQTSVLAHHPRAMAGNDLHKALWRIPIADQNLNMITNITTPAPQSMSRMYSLIIGESLPSDPMELSAAMTTYGRMMDFTAVNRMPFVTSSGRIGLGPISMVHNDRVFVVAGQATPFVLREAGDGQYQVIGDAYIYGMMHGEYSAGDADFADILLR